MSDRDIFLDDLAAQGVPVAATPSTQAVPLPTTVRLCPPGLQLVRPDERLTLPLPRS